MTIDFHQALHMARVAMRTLNLEPQAAVDSQAIIPEALRGAVVEQLELEVAREQTLSVRDVTLIEDPNRRHVPWLHEVDRSEWYYWPQLRRHMLSRPTWPERAVTQLDDATDRILGALEHPLGERAFDTRGLVVGYVQSGKTANYTSLISKAADTGYRVVIVLTGLHDMLRLQTQRRLDAELVGEGRDAVGRPPNDRLWSKFTAPTLDGDFNPGTYSPDGLVGTQQPALFVVKKHVRILERLIDWFHRIPRDARDRLSVLIIDDEADQASVNTGGNRAALPVPETEIEEPDETWDESPPSTTNALIRRLVNSFERKAYIAYTATPFANVLIDHEAWDRDAGEDLYPRDFIVALPQPVSGYYGSERLFGRPEDPDARDMDVMRNVPVEDVALLVPRTRAEADAFEPEIPESLMQAIIDFVLAGAARMSRGGAEEPATMLVHTDYRRLLHQRLWERVSEYLVTLRNEWRYSREEAIEDVFRSRWTNDFRRVTRSLDLEQDMEFEELAPHINIFLESPVQVLQINSSREADTLDYERDPSLKAIVIGGNRLSRGLTLEGLLVSYYVRRARNYDTLMQMGRWFGFREGYADLTRIYMTEELEGWFRALVAVELELREEIERYDREDMTPRDFGPKILQHPGMMVTNRAKMRSAQVVDVSPSFDGKIVQTITFPFHDNAFLRHNIDCTRRFLSILGAPSEVATRNPTASALWSGVRWEAIVDFLNEYRTDRDSPMVDADLLRTFISRQAAQHQEVVRWVVGVMGQGVHRDPLGQLDLSIEGDVEVNLIDRARIATQTSSLKAIITQSDQLLGLSEAQRTRADELGGSDRWRAVRSADEGLLLIYPISKCSGWARSDSGLVPRPNLTDNRAPIYLDSPEDGEHIIGIALAFPKNMTAPPPRSYLVGTAGTAEEE